MKHCFFNIIYTVILLIFLPVLLYRSIRYGKYRGGFKQKYLGRIPRREKVLAKHNGSKKNVKIVWFHGVSVGEVNLLRPLIKLIREKRPDYLPVISTTSLTGMNLANKLFGNELTVFYCPLDFSWAVNKAMLRLKPDMLVLVEQELWFNLIDAAKRSGAKVALINGRFGESGYRRYLWIRRLVAPMLRQIDLIAVQSETYAGWFRKLGASADVIRITGSVKFDGAITDRDNPDTQRLKKLAGIADDDIVFLAGSTQAPEEQYALECYEHLKADFPQLRLVIVPRHPERFNEVAEILDKSGVFWQRRSTITETLPEQEPEELKGGSSRKEVQPRILLVDTIGELGAWWGTAAIAFVGGSMGSRGGQNMLEPAAYGAAVCFGPNTKHFADITELLLRNDAAVVVHDKIDLEKFIRRCFEENGYAEELGNRSKEFVLSQRGAALRTFELLETLLSDR
ncbi:MAG: 3-deoxy-D-manno-octulosonic acid transferase [Planctomycetaceae bacterium]|nr:3-deoxy-D-manno-octulosonic acid transferase [Planctomycetaceae bacterium]